MCPSLSIFLFYINSKSFCLLLQIRFPYFFILHNATGRNVNLQKTFNMNNFNLSNLQKSIFTVGKVIYARITVHQMFLGNNYIFVKM